MLINRKPASLLVFGCLFVELTGCVKSPRVMSWEEYSRRSYTWPYLLTIYTSGGGSLLYYGARHSDNPDDQQFLEIEYLWTQFKPDIAFNEGGDPPVEKTRNEAIRRAGEPGLIRFLAARDKVPVMSLDPTRSQQVIALRKKYSAEQIKLFFILLQMTEYQRIIGGDESPEEHLKKTINILNSEPGLDVEPKSISEVESVFARICPGQGSYKDAKPSWFDPTLTENTFNAISRDSSNFRDRYMLKLIARTVNEKKRVFAVVGASHVVMQEQAIREMLKEKPGR
jgi:CRISPR/Cas system-associated protein endoribonuclease Cas2